MNPTAFDSDTVLTDFLTDYLDGELSTAERESFEEYLSQNKEERKFMRKAYKGKKALAHLAKRMKKPSVTA
ncbi:MAG: zf-HC2 domain-containing protein [Fodinibius sp.]|nr:zf-HC2 domain-containing protein [Fodinibius sp.]